MNTIYIPKGKAREYSPFALNHYLGCDHGCKYCYVKKFRPTGMAEQVHARPILPQLAKDSAAHEAAGGGQVLMCFMGDPYCNHDTQEGLTRKVLQVLTARNIDVAILTKGGNRCLRDLDLFKAAGKRIKVGATLTMATPERSLQYEPGAALPDERLAALATLKASGVRTWASFEPVILADDSLDMIRRSLPFVDQYKLGLTNYFTLPQAIDWNDLTIKAIALFESAGKPYYIKEDLRKRLKFEIAPEHRTMDAGPVDVSGKQDKAQQELF